MNDTTSPTTTPEAPTSVEAPSTTPTTPTPDTAAPAELANDFAGLGQDFDDNGDVEFNLSEPTAGAVKPPVPEEKKEAKPAEPAPAAKPAEAKQPEPPKAPEAPKAPTTGQQGTPQPSATASPPAEPRSLVQQLTEHRAEILDELANSRFSWDKGEEAKFREALDTDPAQALVDWTPRLMARMYHESVTAALNHINQFVPVLMNNYTRLSEMQKAQETALFSQFPQLSKEKHWGDIMQFAAAFGKTPGITPADLIAMVGAATMAKHKLSGQAVAANGGQPPPRKPSVPAFVPAQGGATTTRTPEAPPDPWAGLGVDHDES